MLKPNSGAGLNGSPSSSHGRGHWFDPSTAHQNQILTERLDVENPSHPVRNSQKQPWSVRKKVRVLALVMALMHGMAIADEWSEGDTKREAVYLALHVVDWAQTRDLARRPAEFKEVNPLIGGAHPSVREVDRYFIVAGALHIGISYLLPADGRAGFQYFTILIEGSQVGYNFGMGLKAKF